MREINTQEVQAVSGAGLLTSGLVNTVQTASAAGSAIGSGLLFAGVGLVTGGAILVKPLATGTVKVLKFLI